MPYKLLFMRSSHPQSTCMLYGTGSGDSLWQYSDTAGLFGTAIKMCQEIEGEEDGIAAGVLIGNAFTGLSLSLAPPPPSPSLFLPSPCACVCARTRALRVCAARARARVSVRLRARRVLVVPSLPSRAGR